MSSALAVPLFLLFFICHIFSKINLSVIYPCKAKTKQVTLCSLSLKYINVYLFIFYFVIYFIKKKKKDEVIIDNDKGATS